jgi:Rrf2 family protein
MMAGMRISARADYAIRVLLELAADTTRPITCEAVASTQDIPARFIKAVMRDLRQAGLVRSQRGCEGGYWLAKAAGDVTVRDAVVAVEGEFLSVRGEARTGLPRHRRRPDAVLVGRRSRTRRDPARDDDRRPPHRRGPGPRRHLKGLS